MQTKVALSLLLLVIASNAAFGQAANSGPAPADPEKVAVATKILEETHAQDNMTSYLNTVMPQMLAGIRQQVPSMSDDAFKLVSQMLPDEMKAELPNMLAMEAAVYANHFSLAELKALDDFYHTDIGKKLTAEMPKILQETVPLGMAWGRQAGITAMQHVIEKLRAQGVKI